MGFFSGVGRVLTGIIRTGASLLGLGAPAAAPAAAAGTAIVRRTAARTLGANVRRIALGVPGQLGIGIAAGAAGGALVDDGGAVGPGGVVMQGGLQRGNGRIARQTIVQSIDLMTGQVVRQEIFPGAPFLLQSDVRKLRSTAKKVRKANARLPSRTVRQSKTKALTDTILDRAMQNLLSCPK